MSNATQLNSKKTTSKWTYLQQIMRWHFLWKRQRKISTVHKGNSIHAEYQIKKPRALS